MPSDEYWESRIQALERELFNKKHNFTYKIAKKDTNNILTALKIVSVQEFDNGVYIVVE